MRISDYLREHGIPFETILHPPAFTAQRLARYLGIPGKHVAKSVLLAGPHGYSLAVLPAVHRVDTDALGEHLGGPVRVAEEHEIVEVFHDCEWGLAVPFGSRYGLTTLLDETLAAEAFVVFESQSRAEAIRMSCREFECLERPRRLRFTSQKTEQSQRPRHFPQVRVRLFCPDASWA